MKNLQNFFFFSFALRLEKFYCIVDHNLIVMKRGTVDLCKMFTYGILFGEVTGQLSWKKCGMSGICWFFFFFFNQHDLYTTLEFFKFFFWEVLLVTTMFFVILLVSGIRTILGNFYNLWELYNYGLYFLLHFSSFM